MAFQLIADGYTRTASIDGLTFEYRPILPDQWALMRQWADKLDAKEASKNEALLMAEHIGRWDAELAGEAALVTADNLLKLPPGLFMRVKSELLGFDRNPEDQEGNSEAA